MPAAWHNAERARSESSFLFGATSFRGLLEYWPQQVDNPDAHPADQVIAARYAEPIPITVVSDSLTPEDAEPPTELELLGVRTWAGSDSVVLSYRTRRVS